jgi:hypothetical protein
LCDVGKPSNLALRFRFLLLSAGLDGLRRKIVFFGDDLKAVADKFKSPGTKNL